MLGKRKGSTLYMVLIIMSILFVFGTVMLTLTLSTHKMAYLRSDIKKNLYGAESGLDIAYNIANEHIEKTIEKSNNSVNEQMQEFIEEEMEKEKNKEREKAELQKNKSELSLSQEEFNNELEEIENKGSEYINSDFSLNTEKIYQKENEIFKEKYKEILLQKSQDEEEIQLIKDLEDLEKYKKILGKKLEDYKIPKVEVTNKDEINFSPKEIVVLQLQSKFNQNGIEKSVSCHFNVGVPSYKDVNTISSNTIKIPNNTVWAKALNVGGNMYVNADSTIDGDIYVRGKDESEEENQGVNVNRNNFKVNGNLVTYKDFTVNYSSDSIINGNIYAKNVLMDKIAQGAELNVNKNEENGLGGSVYTADDLEINGDGCKVYIQGDYYGLEDGQNIKASEEGRKSELSSSIIINSSDIRDGSNEDIRLKVDGTAYVMGTSYIKTTPEYQTGESLSIKGNYLAYTYPLLGDVKTSNGNRNLKDVLFGYYKPLALADKFKGDNESLNAKDKSEYFEAYHHQYSGTEEYEENKSILNKVELRDYFSVGAVVSGGEVKSGKYNIEEENRIIDKAKENYIKMVLNMGEDIKEDINEDYGKITIQDSPMKNLSSELDFQKELMKEEAARENQEGYCVVVKKGDYSISNDNNNLGLKNSPKKGIIIIDGNLTINGPMSFTGTLIVTGNLNINGESEITYDPVLVKKLIASNYKEFSKIFKTDSNNDYSYVNIETSWKAGGAKKLKGKEKILKVSQWKILK